MSDVTYEVMVRYVSGGDLSIEIGKAHTSAQGLKGALAEAGSIVGEWGSGLVGHFQEAVEHAGHLVAHLAKIGIAAGVAGAAYGVGNLNAQLESTQVSLAAIFNAQGLTGGGFNNAFATAGDQVEKMKNDIKKLPGDLGEMSNVMLQLASPLGRIGKDPDAIRRITGQTMMASQILLGAKYGAHGAQEIGAREMAMLLQGNFGARNTWAMELPGMQQYKAKWKSMNEEERFKVVQERMSNLVESTRAKFETSWAAVWTTFRDDMKYSLLAPATLPLFNAVKKSLNDLHDWMEKNDTKVKSFTTKLGDGLADAWRRGVEIAEEWWPRIIDFAQQLKNELEVLWTQFAPAIKSVADDLKTALGDGTIMKDIKEVLKLYAETKVAGVALGAAGGALKMGGSIAQIANATAASEGGIGLGAVAAGGAITVAVAAFLGAASLGEFHALADKNSPNHDASVEAAENLKGSFGRTKEAVDTDVVPSLEKFGIAMTNALAWLVDPNSIDWKALVDPNYGKAAKELDDFTWAMEFATTRITYNREREMHFPVGGVSSGKTINEQLKDLYATKKGAGHGGGGTHIQKVEIVVSSTQDAGRVAEMVHDKLVNIHRHPKVSPNVPNYSMR